MTIEFYPCHRTGFFLLYFYIIFPFYKNNSNRNTTMHAHTDTCSRLFPNHASAVATIRAAHADQTLPVADRIAGKVITASVTYGT